MIVLCAWLLSFELWCVEAALEAGILNLCSLDARMKLLLRFILATAALGSQGVWRVSDGCQESIPVDVTPDRAGSETFLSQEL